MATVVLVHGSFIGSWGWQRLTRFLRRAGHAVSAPSLTGVGERVHLASPELTLDTHITDVVNHLVYEDLTNVTLVGWSSGGMVITGVAEQVPERISQLIYLDAIVPTDGQSLFDADGASAEQRADEWATSEAAGTPGFNPPPVEWIREHLPPEDEPEWITERMTAHPIATDSQPLTIKNRMAAAIPRAYILCTADKEWEDIPWFHTVDRIKGDPAWRYREVAVAHIGPLTTPEPVAEVLLELIHDRHGPVVE
jgi:pimeloyl-ACP methyl ester carboxylesterase